MGRWKFGLTQKRVKELHDQLAEGRNPKLADVIERNIEIIALLKHRAEERRSLQERISDGITNASGSMLFVYLHVLWFGVWIYINTSTASKFDPFPFGFLTMIVSLEAIFLSTFVLISQNREGAINEAQEALDLQIDLLAEYEITRMLRLVDKMAEKMGIEDAFDEEIDQLCMPVAPDVVIHEIERQTNPKK